jgi:hypothetical protein
MLSSADGPIGEQSSLKIAILIKNRRVKRVATIMRLPGISTYNHQKVLAYDLSPLAVPCDLLKQASPDKVISGEM